MLYPYWKTFFTYFGLLELTAARSPLHPQKITSHTVADIRVQQIASRQIANTHGHRWVSLLLCLHLFDLVCCFFSSLLNFFVALSDNHLKTWLEVNVRTITIYSYFLHVFTVVARIRGNNWLSCLLHVLFFGRGLFFIFLIGYFFF